MKSFLGRMLFKDEDVMKKVRVLSGGEKMRCMIARMQLKNANCLILDTPTNHLDLEMRQALSMALQVFEGALLLVSHDRHLLKSTIDELYLVANGSVQAFDGDLDDYSRWLAEFRQQQLSPASVASAEASNKIDRKAQRQAAAALRQQLAPYRKQADKLEQQLDQTQNHLQRIEQQLANPSIYETVAKDQLKTCLAEQAKFKAEAEQLELAWLECLEQLEELQQQLETAE